MQEIHALPKIELHAHLSGCISQQKLVELLDRRGCGESFELFDCHEDMSNALAKCFEYFDKVSKVVSDLATLKECALHVLDSYAAENCLYLELRTSPKQLSLGEHGGTSSKMQYLQTVSDAVEEFRSYASERFGFIMEVGLLLSVDRGKISSRAAAHQQLDDVFALAEAFPDLVVGIDVCGNPASPSVVPHLLPALLERKAAFASLPITFHTAEIEDAEESQLILKSMRDLNIRRLGHVCFFPEACRKAVLEGGIHGDGGSVGVELCPTSNMVTKNLLRLEDHHFADWWKKSDKVLLSICTDDRGLFSVSLSQELRGVAQAFALSALDVADLQRQALLSSFHRDKASLLSRFERLVASATDARLARL